MKNLILEFDDFHYSSPVNCIDHIDKYVSLFSDIKITLFTSAKYNGQPIDRAGSEEWKARVIEYTKKGNIQIAVHGLEHTIEEFKNLNYHEAHRKLEEAHKIFDNAGIPFVKVFRGPHWGLNASSIFALNDLGYTHLYNHTDYIGLNNIFKSKVIYYSWNLKDSYVEDKSPLVVGHGHTHNVCQNGIEETFERVTGTIKNYKPNFLFANEA